MKPSARRDHVGGWHSGPRGNALAIEVRSPAVEGAATEAARRMLAEAIGVPASRVSLRSGNKSRLKRFSIASPPGDVDRTIERLRGG